MNHRPYCAAAALGLLLAALSVGPLFRCPGPRESDASDPPLATSAAITAPPAPVSETLAVVPVEASASRKVQSAGFTPGGPSFRSRAVPASFSRGPADPDEVGPCPQADLPAVLRRGRDVDGQDTWWHADGSITKRGTRAVAGEVVPFVTRMQAVLERVGRDTPVHVVDEHEPVVVK